MAGNDVSAVSQTGCGLRLLVAFDPGRRPPPRPKPGLRPLDSSDGRRPQPCPHRHVVGRCRLRRRMDSSCGSLGVWHPCDHSTQAWPPNRKAPAAELPSADGAALQEPPAQQTLPTALAGGNRLQRPQTAARLGGQRLWLLEPVPSVDAQSADPQYNAPQTTRGFRQSHSRPLYFKSLLALVARHPVAEAVHGAGGIAHHVGRFIVIGGLPLGTDENYAYEYDGQFKFIQRHVLKSGQTLMGIQTAAFADDRWWFGCYGLPPVLLTADGAGKSRAVRFRLLAGNDSHFAGPVSRRPRSLHRRPGILRPPRPGRSRCEARIGSSSSGVPLSQIGSPREPLSQKRFPSRASRRFPYKPEAKARAPGRRRPGDSEPTDEDPRLRFGFV